MNCGAVPLVAQAFRSLKAPASVRQHVHIKQRDRGLDEAAMIESFVVLNAVGGECVVDFAHLRADAGLSELLTPRAAFSGSGAAVPEPVPCAREAGRGQREPEAGAVGLHS
ncbi:MAG: hypothetical protein ACP5E2_06950 [Terracidiphilus sp.]